jgi:hypothetical protein
VSFKLVAKAIYDDFLFIPISIALAASWSVSLPNAIRENGLGAYSAKMNKSLSTIDALSWTWYYGRILGYEKDGSS